MISITVDVKGSKITGKILSTLRDVMGRVYSQSAIAIQRRFGELAEDLIQGTAEYSSLIQGELLGELGIPDVESRLQGIFAAIKKGISVRTIPMKVVGGNLVGGLTIGILRSDYEDILSLSDASYISSPSGANIPWLGWLIGSGDAIVVFDHNVTFDLNQSQKNRSRTGQALMIPGSGWRVPPEYSGVPGNNFLTRAFDVPKVASLMCKIIEEELRRRL